jgi:hypothetical protein
MKTIIISLFIICTIFLAQKQSIGQQFIENDTIWASDTVRIYNDIVVENQATLQIDPGIYVEFQDNFSLTVFGKIKARGTINDTIVFTVNNAILIDDTTTHLGGWGGIRLLSNENDTSIFEYCKFTYGKAVDPGAFWGDPHNEDNKGGAIYINKYGHFRANNCTFYHNRANYAGGGIYVNECKTLKIINNCFKYNSAYFIGGGIFIESSVYSLIYNNLFYLNESFYVSPSGFGGGAGSGLALYDNAVVYSNLFFNNNSVNGALYESSYNSFISNNISANNMGTGMVFAGWDHGVSKLINNTIVNNKSYIPGGCGILFFGDNAIMRNNIVSGNTFHLEGIDPIQVWTPREVKADFAYSCNPDEAIYYQGEGNIQDDPQFVNPTPGAGPDYDGLSADWSLLDSSPCVNTGTPDTSGLNLPATDLLGNPRIYGIRIDMGAIENQTVVGLPENLLVNARVQVSPNPFGQSFKVISPGREKISSFRLFNQKGQQIGMETLMPIDQILVFDLGYQPPGLYLLVTRFEDGTSETTKLVKY